MASALDTLDRANLHHGGGLVAAGLGTLSGFLASLGLGALYGAKRDVWYGKYSPYAVAVLGKLAALGFVFAGWNGAAIVANDVGQAGVNAVGLNLGVVLGLKIAKKKLAITDESTALPAGYTQVAGDLPPAAPGRSLENLSVEDLANLN